MKRPDGKNRFEGHVEIRRIVPILTAIAEGLAQQAVGVAAQSAVASRKGCA
ncbi:hypothetical protein VSR68_00805 [Paraburkholderia phymatum]|uniref:hypothetical protein n=1 Tax=Paraburkholderia phymatum TaxID=148447 RepID=UPI0031719178